MASRKILDSMKERVLGAGAELAARGASRALDALQTASRVRGEVPGRLKAAARKVPIVGRRLGKGRAATAVVAAAEEVKAAVAAPAKEAKRAAAQRRVSTPTKIHLERLGPSPEEMRGRKVVTAGGRKTMPAAAAKRLRQKAKPHPFKAKRGQKKRH